MNESEVLGLLPDEFLRAYEELANRALALLSSRDYGREMSEGGKFGYGSGRGEKGFTVSKDGIKDERFFHIKQEVDRKLRALVRTEISKALSKEVGNKQRAEKAADGQACSRCKRFVSNGWKYCSGCGVRL